MHVHGSFRLSRLIIAVNYADCRAVVGLGGRRWLDVTRFGKELDHGYHFMRVDV